MGQLHSIQVLEHHFSKIGFIFLFSGIQDKLKRYNYIQQKKVKEICKTAHFYISCTYSLKKYFKFLFSSELITIQQRRNFIFSNNNKNSHLKKLWVIFEDLLMFSQYYYSVTHGRSLSNINIF